MAILGTKMINLRKLYFCASSNAVRRYTYVLPVPVSISILKFRPSSLAPGSIPFSFWIERTFSSIESSSSSRLLPIAPISLNNPACAPDTARDFSAVLKSSASFGWPSNISAIASIAFIWKSCRASYLIFIRLNFFQFSLVIWFNSSFSTTNAIWRGEIFRHRSTEVFNGFTDLLTHFIVR